MKKSKILITAVLMFLFTMCIAPITTFGIKGKIREV